MPEKFRQWGVGRGVWRLGGHDNKSSVRWLVVLVGLCSGLFAVVAVGAEPTRVVLSMPGPHLAPMLPLELIPRIGADAAEGLQLEIRYFGGGPLAANDMLNRNSDFAVFALAAMAGIHLKSPEIMSVAAITRVPAYTLLVRKDLRSQVRKIADLRGRSVGVHSAKQGNKSTSRQLVEYLLLRAGVAPEQVNFVSTGQKSADYEAALTSGRVDAIVVNEPEAALLVSQGKAAVLVDLHGQKDTRATMGGLFLYTQLSTRRELITREPDKIRRMVAALGRSLRWIQQHTPEQISAALALPDAQQTERMREFLQRHKDIYNTTPAFSAEQVNSTERFFRAVAQDEPGAAVLSFHDIIEPRWAGRTR